MVVCVDMEDLGKWERAPPPPHPTHTPTPTHTQGSGGSDMNIKDLCVAHRRSVRAWAHVVGEHHSQHTHALPHEALHRLHLCTHFYTCSARTPLLLTAVPFWRHRRFTADDLDAALAAFCTVDGPPCHTCPSRESCDNRHLSKRCITAGML